MAEKTEKAEKAEKADDKAPAKVKGVIMSDDVWSSQGKHKKGEKWEGSAEDAAVLEERGFLTRL